MRTLARLLRTPPADWLLLLEAAVLLTASRAALHRVPIARLMQWLGRRPLPANPAGNRLQAAHRVQWAIRAIARRFPGTFVCFPQSVAAFLMLQRRGIRAVIYYGVDRSPERELRAHTWLDVDGFTVVGGEAAPEFTVIQTFP